MSTRGLPCNITVKCQNTDLLDQETMYKQQHQTSPGNSTSTRLTRRSKPPTCHTLHSLIPCCPAPFSLPSSLMPLFNCEIINYKYALLDNFPLFLLLPNLLQLPPPALYSPPRHSSPFTYSSRFPPCLPACALPHASKHSY